MSTGFAVQNLDRFGGDPLGVLDHLGASAISQPPVLGTPVKLRVRISPSLRAVTLKLGVVVQNSCSM